MFPIRWDFPFRRKDGKLSTIKDEIDAAGGGGGGGSVVDITPVLTEGTKIADFEIDGEEGSLYAPASSGGTQIHEFVGTMNSKTYSAKTWVDGIIDVSTIPDYANKTFFAAVSNESGYTAMINQSGLTLTNYVSLMVYAINAATNKQLSVTLYYY